MKSTLFNQGCRVSGLIVLLGVFFVASPAFADGANIDIKIGADHTATGAWSATFANEGMSQYVPEFEAYDSAVSTKYKLQSVYQGTRSIQFGQYDQGIM